MMPMIAAVASAGVAYYLYTRTKLMADYPLEITFSEPNTMSKKQKIALIHLFSKKYIEVASVVRQLQLKVASLEKERERSIDCLLWCPECGERHIDEGEFSTKSHHTHACQHCGMCWRPAVACTVGVLFLPGFKTS